MSSDKKHAENQLETFKSQHRVEEMRTQFGAPYPSRTASLTAGPRGPLLIQDHLFLEELSSFDRERIPERVVHAKGAGAHGYFEVTHDITKYTKASVFSEIGKRTPIFLRFSTVGGESGSADTARDPRGFAMKFYTEDGNWDLVGNNTPIFFIRDPILFPSFIHTQKRNPATHLKDPNMVWDFFSLRPETMHQFMFLFSDRGVPDGYRHMNGYGSHTFKLVNAQGEAVYCKFHSKTAQGIKNLSSSDAEKLSGTDPDYSIRDLYNNIESGNYPQWNFFIQVMTMEQADKCSFNPFDLTKVWPHGEYPLIPVGKWILNKNPTNYFAEVEQSAFSPSHVIPGIEFSPDKMLQGRLFSYKDTHYHRLGPNHTQLPINCPYRARVNNIQRDGLMATGNNSGGTPNYFPNSFNGATPQGPPEHKWTVSGEVARYETGGDDNFSQPRVFWEKVLNEAERKRLVENIADSLSAANDPIQQRSLLQFKQVHPDMASQISSALQARKHRAHL